jgi:hypothetical protein
MVRPLETIALFSKNKVSPLVPIRLCWTTALKIENARYGNVRFLVTSFWGVDIRKAGSMPHNKVRALCAQIALEIDPAKAAALIDELTQVLLGDYLKLLDKSPQELQLKPGRKADA